MDLVIGLFRFWGPYAVRNAGRSKSKLIDTIRYFAVTSVSNFIDSHRIEIEKNPNKVSLDSNIFLNEVTEQWLSGYGDLSRFSFKELKKTFHVMKSDISLFSDDPKNSSIRSSIEVVMARKKWTELELESGEFLVSLSTKKSFYFSFELLIYILFISHRKLF